MPCRCCVAKNGGTGGHRCRRRSWTPRNSPVGMMARCSSAVALLPELLGRCCSDIRRRTGQQGSMRDVYPRCTFDDGDGSFGSPLGFLPLLYTGGDGVAGDLYCSWPAAWEISLLINSENSLTEPYVAHILLEAISSKYAIFFGNSMPIRDANMYGWNGPECDHNLAIMMGLGSCHYIQVGANRGASGIDADLVKVGFTALKLKEIRRKIGGEIELRADANRNWSYEKAIQFAHSVKDYCLQYIEVRSIGKSRGRVESALSMQPTHTTTDSSMRILTGADASPPDELHNSTHEISRAMEVCRVRPGDEALPGASADIAPRRRIPAEIMNMGLRPEEEHQR
nr:protein PHYLLO, chloroplastic isoform X2 [Ipomoea batatas]